jgi:diadenylate cyclase
MVVLDVLRGFRIRDLVDIGIVAFVLYRVFVVFKGTVALQMLGGLGFLMLARFLSHEADLHSLSFILENFWAYWVIALIVLYQPELRRTLAQAGQNRLVQRVLGQAATAREQLVEELARVAESLAGKRIGALIVVERRAGLGSYTELGVRMEAVVSAELLGSIFQPGSPLHDGAAIVQRDRISAAGCFLPLSRDLQLARTLGTRHRAALGISEETDAVVVVVSEETGAVSVAVDGAIERGLDPVRFRVRLGELLGARREAPIGARSFLAGVRRLTVREKA